MGSRFIGELPERLWALYAVAQIGSRYLRPIEHEEFIALTNAALAGGQAAIIAGGQSARQEICLFFFHLHETLGGGVPLSWQRVFREAFDGGAIDGIVLGAAVRMIYRYNSPEPQYRGEDMAATLANLRIADRTGIMLPQERDIWEALPERVTIFRGAFAHTAIEAAQGLSWSLSRGYASAHLYRRSLPIHAATDIRQLLGMDSPPRQLIEATVSKTAILAAMCSSDYEVFVDYERIAEADIQSLPTNALLRRGVVEAAHRIVATVRV